MQKRDFFTKRVKNLHLDFFLSPFKELSWWLIYFLKFCYFYFSKYFFIRSRKFFLKKSISYARKNIFSKQVYSSIKPLFELQIGSFTRDALVCKENEVVSFHSNGEKNSFIFGISPLIEIYNLKKVHHWTLMISIYKEDELLEELKINFPLNESNRTTQLVYSLDNGWIDFILDISKYKSKNIEIKLQTSIKKVKNDNFLEDFSVSFPQFKEKKTFEKNIIFLSLESLSDFNFLKEAYGFNNYSNLDNFISESTEYKEVFSPVDATLTYAASMLSGLMPSQHGIGDYSMGSDTYFNKVINKNIDILPKRLKKKDFLTFFYGTAGRFSSKIGFADGFDDHFQVNSNFDSNRPSINTLINGIEAYKGFDKFFFFHLDHLHEPLLSFGNENKPRTLNPYVLDKKNTNINSQLYKLGLERVDRDIGFLIKYLKDNQLYDGSLIILTGDHGSGINWTKGSDYSLYDERLRVPLIVKYPNWFEIEDDVNKSINSAFKINEIINTAIGSKFNSDINLLPQYDPKYSDYCFSETIMMPRKERKRHCFALIYKNMKYICWNLIDWDKFTLIKTLDEKVFLRNKLNFFDESQDVINLISDADVSKLKQVTYEIIERNLEFMKKYPPQDF